MRHQINPQGLFQVRTRIPDRTCHFISSSDEQSWNEQNSTYVTILSKMQQQITISICFDSSQNGRKVGVRIGIDRRAENNVCDEKDVGDNVLDEENVGDKVGRNQSWHKCPSAPRALRLLRLRAPFLPTYPFLSYNTQGGTLW